MNNVGVLAVGPVEVISLEGWERVIDINLMSVVRSLTVYLPGLLEQRSGHIVNTASTAGCSPMATTGFRTPRRNMPSSACPKRWRVPAAARACRASARRA